MLSLRQLPRAAWTLYRTFGARGASLRTVHELKRILGRFRGSPRHRLAERAAVGRAFAVAPDHLAATTDRGAALYRAERVLAGDHQAYRWTWKPLPHTPEAWLTHPVTGRVAEADLPWWQVSHLNATAGDIKDLWEPARFGWAYDLVRGYLLTGNDRFAAVFHENFAAWLESSPPFKGPHWSCGQETAVRAVALLYAEANLAGAPSSTPQTMRRLHEVLAASGERIRDAIGYAISQRNNHAISEAAGLIALGVRLRGSHPEADAWLASGRRLLERLIREQFADDGWYIQHSFTYLRLALDQCIVAERALRSIRQSLSPGAVARLRSAVELLLAVIEPESGIVPNHGPNDGAFVHPITLAAYRDFRPVITAACATWRFPMPANVAPDAEVLAWLGEEPVAEGPPLEDGVWNGASGWAVVRAGRVTVFLRAGSYTSRPGHIDPLHLDVRIGGREVIVDPGTYAYNAPPPWRNGLAGAKVHNGPLVDGREPGVRGPRFLWYLWPEARLERVGRVDDCIELVAAIPGVVRRTVRVRPDEVVVKDEVLRRGAREAVVRWLLHPDADPVQVEVPGGVIEEASEGGVVGWFSPGYGVRRPSCSVVVRWDPSSTPRIRAVIRAKAPVSGMSNTSNNDKSEQRLTI